MRAGFEGYYTEQQINVWLAGRTPKRYFESIKRNETFVAKEAGKIIGFIQVFPGEIRTIYIDPVFQGRGIGKKLLQYGIQIASKNHESVMAQATLNAEQFYLRYGFRKVKDSFVLKSGIKIPVIIMKYIVKK